MSTDLIVGIDHLPTTSWKTTSTSWRQISVFT